MRRNAKNKTFNNLVIIVILVAIAFGAIYLYNNSLVVTLNNKKIENDVSSILLEANNTLIIDFISIGGTTIDIEVNKPLEYYDNGTLKVLEKNTNIKNCFHITHVGNKKTYIAIPKSVIEIIQNKIPNAKNITIEPNDNTDIFSLIIKNKIKTIRINFDINISVQGIELIPELGVYTNDET